MLIRRYIGASVLMIGLSIVTLSTTAQTPSPLQRQIRSQRVRGAPQQPQQQAPSLADILDKVDWDPATRGTLLIVSPETTFPVTPSTDSRTGGMAADSGEPQPPIATAAGTYSFAAAAPAYDRIVVHLGNLTVLAPRTMTVLHYTHLPKPDPYAGMSPSAKLRLLESTFTDAQWATASSEAGIGTSELSADQSAVFLSILPQPFDVTPLQAAGTATAPGTAVALTEEQRAATHLRLQKRLDWSFKQGASGGVGFGLDTNQIDSVYSYRLAFVMPANLVPGPNGTLIPCTAIVYGVDVATVVPNRAKPSHLPSGWAAIDAVVTLESARTVGSLVKEVARQTGAKLYCDPRYSKLTVALLGDSAKASDLLRALCWAVTGTWRRVGDSFVLTDDLVGLGVRHVMIDDWMEQNALLTQLLNEKANKIVAPKEYTSIGWSASDPMKPGDALSGKLDAFVAQPPIPYPNNGSAEQSPDIPLTDLPQAVRDKIREQVQNFNQRLTTQQTNGQPEQPISADGVKLGVRVQASYIIPGVGRLAANDLSGTGMNQNFIAKPYIFPNYLPGTGSTLPPLKFNPTLTNRALLIDSSNVMEIETAAVQAHQRGFTQLWVVVPAGDSDLLATAVHAGRKNALAVHAVVRLLRPGKSDLSNALDRNLLGETTTEYVKRRRAEVKAILAKTGPIDERITRMGALNLSHWIPERTIELLLQSGDFRQTTLTEQAAISAEVSRLAAVPGLAGIVLQDKESPGSEAVSAKFGENYLGTFSGDFGMQMGYDDTTRLDCLQQLGFDPIDLSPLPHGDENQNIGLPFFRDSGGLEGQSMSYVLINGHKPVSTSLWPGWCEFRHARSEALVASVAKAARAQHPDIPILIRRFDALMDTWDNWYESLEKPDANKTTPARPIYDTYNKGLHDRALAESRISYFPVVLGIGSLDQIQKPSDDQLGRLTYALKAAAAWDGLVVDLTRESPAETIASLALFPVIDSGN